MPGMGKTILKRALYYPITCRNRSCMCGTHTGLSRSLFVRNKSSFNVSDSILLIMYRLTGCLHIYANFHMQKWKRVRTSAKIGKDKNECKSIEIIKTLICIKVKYIHLEDDRSFIVIGIGIGIKRVT